MRTVVLSAFLLAFAPTTPAADPAAPQQPAKPADAPIPAKDAAKAMTVPEGFKVSLFAGEPVNVTEGRAAEHSAERGEGADDSVARAAAFHARMRGLIDAIEAEALGPIRHILHIGIGGSALGPELLIDALGREGGRYDVALVDGSVRFVSQNIDMRTYQHLGCRDDGQSVSVP